MPAARADGLSRTADFRALGVSQHEKRVVGPDTGFDIAQGNGGLKPLRIRYDPLAKLHARLVENQRDLAGCLA